MTRKDYQLIEQCVNKALKETGNCAVARNYYLMLVKTLSEELLRDNDRFNQVKFVDACFMVGE